VFKYPKRGMLFNDDEIKDSDSDEEDDLPANRVPSEMNLDEEESKADGGLGRSGSKGGRNSKKHFGYVEFKGFQEAVEELELAQTENMNIQSYRDKYPYLAFVK
jgi:hypothetical protein